MKKPYLSWVLKGAAMGAADAVPGVSGGTIALITGIYGRFISALASFKPSLLSLLFKGEFKQLWRAIDGEFLTSLGLGIVISLFGMLSLMHWLLQVAEPMVWAFFFGVILASLWGLYAGTRWIAFDWVLLCLGLVIALSLIFGGNALIASGYALSSTPIMLVIGGALAISAMLLPGISGSFILLLLGLYPVVVEAVHERNIAVVLWVALGCVIGILAFSRVLKWALDQWEDRVIKFMMGFVAGALVKVWPWQQNNLWLLPSEYEVLSSGSSFVLGSAIVFCVGFALVFILQKRA